MAVPGGGPEPLTVAGDPELSGERSGGGQPVVCLHGITATRRYVLHGSRALARSGREVVAYDARGHGESGPAPGGGGYAYPELVADLGRVIESACERPPVLAGHSMGAHTAAAFALADPGSVAAVVLICPASLGLPPPPEALEHWDRLAEGLEGGGVDGFMRAYEGDLQASPEWRETLLRIARERLSLHRRPEALVGALREVPRSVPFDGLAELESLAPPALVVASRDEADPGHPYAVAEAWAEAIPGAALLSEEVGQSPLAWQGGRLARAIAEFCEGQGL